MDLNRIDILLLLQSNKKMSESFRVYRELFFVQSKEIYNSFDFESCPAPAPSHSREEIKPFLPRS
jgi:hypothetical protein